MRKWFYILLLTLGSLSVARADHWGVEHENVLSIRYGGVWQQDQYLSPLLYSGQQIGLSTEWWQGFKKDSTKHWQHVGQMYVTGSMAYSERMNNLIYSVGLQGGWGAQYVWKWQDLGLQALLGPYLDMELCGKMQASNVNKPYSMDLAVNICALGGVSWAFKAQKTSYRLHYLVRLNVLGMDYLPDYWHSYFEMGEGVLGDFRCAGLWNHRHLKHELTLDMQFIRSTWRVGIAHEYLEYGTIDMMFSRETVSAVLGYVWHYKVNPAKSFVPW